MMNAVLEENHQLVAQTPPPGGKCPLLRRRAAPWDRPIPSISPHPLTPIAAAAFEGEGGTGGKAPKRPLRRPRLKPYDPPPGRALFTSAVEKNNWLTEFVYSASRTIARSCKKSSEENHQLAEFNQGGDVGAKHANPISEIEHLLSKKTFTRAQSILIIELLRSKTPELSILEAVPFEERQESGKQSIRSDSTISVSAVKPMMRKRKMSSLDDDFESSEPQRKIPRWTISECTTVPLIEKPAFQTTISEELNMDDEEPAFRMAIPEDFLEIDDDEDNSCDIGPIATTLPVLEKPSFHMTAPEDLSESDNDECDLNDIEFAFHVSHAPQTEQFEFGSEQCWHPAFKQCTSL